MQNKILEKCHENCKECNGPPSFNNNNCSKCPDENTKYFNLGNCTDKCINGYYEDDNSNKICKCTYNIKCYDCSEESNKLNLCISCNKEEGYYEINETEMGDNLFVDCYKKNEEHSNNLITIPQTEENTINYETCKYYKNNECVNNCSASEIFVNICGISDNDNTEFEDEIIYKIKSELINGQLNFLLTSVIFEKNDDLIINNQGKIYQITTSDNQNKNDYDNISTIKFDDCEKKLKKQYNIPKNESLLILKMDKYNEGSLIPIIEYEVYNPSTKQQLDLDACENIQISIYLPVIINESVIYKYNQSSDYYNDICYTYSNENGADITLADRKNEFNEKNLSLCESNCEFKEYDPETKKAKCDCSIKKKLSLMKDIANNKEFVQIFSDVKNMTNIHILKCYKSVFSSKGLKYNYGNYILLFNILIYIICLILFLVKENNKIYKLIDKIIKNKANALIDNSKNIIININDEDFGKKNNKKDGKKIMLKVKTTK